MVKPPVPTGQPGEVLVSQAFAYLRRVLRSHWPVYLICIRIAQCCRTNESLFLGAPTEP